MSNGLIHVASVLRSFAFNQIIASAVRMDLFGLVRPGPISFESLSEQTRVPVNSLRALVAVLDDLELLKAEDDFVVPALGTEFLHRDGGALYGQALLCADEYYRVWKDLDETLRTGQSAFQRVYGQDFWTYLRDHPETSQNFSRTMSAGTSESVDSIISAYPYEKHKTVVDVGAGNGTFAGSLAERHQGLEVIALDLPNQIKEAADRLKTHGGVPRVKLVSADMFTDPLPAADLYTLKGVVHNWSDEAALRILQRIRESSPSARVLVIERTIDDKREFDVRSAMNTLTMSLLFGSSERTSDEYQDLLLRAGYKYSSTTQVNSGLSLIAGDTCCASNGPYQAH